MVVLITVAMVVSQPTLRLIIPTISPSMLLETCSLQTTKIGWFAKSSRRPARSSRSQAMALADSAVMVVPLRTLHWRALVPLQSTVMETYSSQTFGVGRASARSSRPRGSLSRWPGTVLGALAKKAVQRVQLHLRVLGELPPIAMGTSSLQNTLTKKSARLSKPPGRSSPLPSMVNGTSAETAILQRTHPSLIPRMSLLMVKETCLFLIWSITGSVR